jgi:tRNA pseudouridine-54 N-methylase
MDLVIFNDTYPPLKEKWATSSMKDRLAWSWICEVVATWFCYSNGIRKNNNVTIIIGSTEIRIIGSKIRYLAPTQRSVMSIISSALKVFEGKIHKKYQPGVYIDEFKGLERFPKPWKRLVLNKNSESLSNPVSIHQGTLFIHEKDEEIPSFSISANDYVQALVWLIYSRKAIDEVKPLVE